MAVIQITKITIRRGPEDDLPGAPTSLDPLVFSAALETGEFGFASDTGRLFIGHDPESGQPNYNRTTFPYQNIEVLTENSSETLSRIVSQVLRSTGRDSFTQATLASTADDDWGTVEAIPETGSPAPFRFSGPNLAAAIEYSVFSSTNAPIRNGVLRVSHPGDGTEPSLIDEAVSHARLEFGTDSDYDPTLVYGSLRFRFSLVSISGADHYEFQYQNGIGASLKLFFRYTRVVP